MEAAWGIGLVAGSGQFGPQFRQRADIACKFVATRLGRRGTHDKAARRAGLIAGGFDFCGNALAHGFILNTA